MLCYFLNAVKTNKPDVKNPILLLSFIPMASIQVELKRQHLKLEIKMKFKRSYNNLC